MAVPPRFAQETVDTLVKAGVTAIWNFVAAHVEAPEHILVENADFTPSLAVFTYRISESA